MEVLTGFRRFDAGSSALTMPEIAWGRLKDVKFKIDLYVMINARNARVENRAFSQSNPNHVQTLCELLGLDPSRIRPALID